MQVDSVLMIHGAGGGGWEWSSWSRVFAAAGWRVSAPDLMPAAAGLADTSLRDYEAQVRDWMRALRPRLVIGASLGGLLALRCHDAAAGAALVLVNPMPPAGFAPASPPARIYPDIVPWRSTASLASTARTLPDADPSSWHDAWRRWRDESGRVLKEAATGPGIQHPAAPVLMIVSAADRDVTPSTSRALATALSADVLELPGASHVGPLLGRSAPIVAARVLNWGALRN